LVHVRSRLALGALLFCLVPLADGVARAQDFDPRGRHRPPPGGRPATPPGGRPATPPGGRPATPPGGRPATPPGGRPGTAPGTTPGTAPAGNPDAGASQAALIDRYTKIVLSQPGSPFPLQRLAQLYRDKDGNLTGLVADFERRAAAPGADAYPAMVTLAGVYKIDGRPEDAIRTYEKAIAIKNNDPSALLALARVLQDRGDVVGARARYEAALALQTLPADKEQTLRTLMALALDAKDWTGAKAFHGQLVKMQPTSLFVKGELGRELFLRSEFERAEAEFKELVTAAAGDNRALAPALKDLGKAQAKAHKNPEAIATLKKALAAAGAEAAVRAEIYETITEIYRADQQLPILIKQIEDEHPNDFARLALLGALYEETGDAVNALRTYQKALAINPRHIDLRLKMIRLLQGQGELDKAIAEYEGLIRSAPNNPTFVFEQCDALLQRGDRARALTLLTALEARASTDEEVLSRLADFYGRIGENERSLKVLTRLAQVGQNDPSHLVDLGDRYFQDGNTQLAVATWRRILTTVSPRARALAALGDVYLEHDMNADALVVLREAVSLDPQNLAFKKQLAGALERARNYREARALWQELGDKAKKTNDKVLARETRGHMVTLWGLERVIDAQVAPLTVLFNGNPPDIEAGRTLAEVQIHVRKVADAEATLRRVIQLAPGDGDSYLALERGLVQQSKLQDAIAVLEKLVVVEPKRARELYQRMAQYALQLYRDDDAIKYAARAVELNPDDAEGHRRLGEMYRSRQDSEHAIVEFRAALAKNDRLYIVYFELADLLLSKGDTEEADRLFRRVIRGAPDEELVARASRLSMQINLGKGTLESLEQELLPMAIGNPQKSIYRRLLVEIYGNLTFGLVQRVRHAEGKDAEEARTALARIGARAVKPLLDALADSDAGQQRIAIDVLGYVQNKNAGAPLFAFAIGPAEPPLRARAMVACGRLRDPALLPKYEALLLPKSGAQMEEGTPTDSIAVAAVWGLARMQDKHAGALLRRLTRRGTSEMQALAVLGLGLLHDKSSTADIAATARGLDSGNVARAAAAYALGELDAESETPTLLSLAQGTEALPRQLALVALARMASNNKTGEPPGGKAALAAMADAVFAGGDNESARARQTAEALQRAGTASLILLANAREPSGAHTVKDPLPASDGVIDVEATLGELVPKDFTEKERVAAVVKYGDSLEHAAISALQTSSDRSRAVLDAIGAGDGSLRPFFGGEASPGLAPGQARAKKIAHALEPAVLTSLSRHPDATLRTKAVVLLANSDSDAATDAVVSAVSDPNEAVQRIAIAAIGSHANPRAVAAVGKLLAMHENWAMRILAVQALGRLGTAGSTEAGKHLREAAAKDQYALVREAALKALASFDPHGGQELAHRMAMTDAEPRVRETAAAIARGAR
jgi:tetratricopeptide (TPR) repeat protein/HEAT repeat protein